LETHQLAVLATKTSHALAGVTTIRIETTALVQARVVLTLINIVFTVHTSVPATQRQTCKQENDTTFQTVIFWDVMTLLAGF
jgi:hypothetical protein